jgi:hypothetical protein
MNEIDPKIVEYAKEMYGETCELVRRSEWSYSFKCDSCSAGLCGEALTVTPINVQ